MALYSRLQHWAKLLGLFVSVQLLVQAMGFLGGILVIRLLSQQEYAYFTIANTMQGTMALMTDLGISISLMSIGGKVWNDRVAFSRLVKTATKLRSLMALGAGVVIVPLSLWLLLKQGASWGYTLLILTVVAAGFSFQVSSGIYVVVLRLHSRIKELQISDFLSTGSRLLCLGAFCLLPFNACLALCAALASFAVQAWLMRHWGREVVDHEAEPDPEYRVSMLKVVANQAPNGIYYCFQGQISIWLIGTFGQASGVAEIGALGRLAVIFSIAGGVLNNLVLPSFSKCQEHRSLLRRYVQIIGIYSLFCIVMVFTALFFSDELLWILGKNYANLHTELFWMVLSTVVGSLGATLWAVNSSRGWIDYAWLYIPGTLLTQAFLLTMFKVSTVEGAIQFGLWSNLPSYLLNLMMTWRGFRKMRSEAALAGNPEGPGILHKLRDSWRWRSSFAFYGFLRRMKLAKNPAIAWKKTDPAAPRFVSCVYAADVPLLRQCLKTLHERNSSPPKALLVGDSPEAVRALKLAFADAEGGDYVEIAFWEDLLKGLPKETGEFVRAWLGGGPFGGYAKKFAVTLATNAREPIVMCDADVLFGGDFFAAMKGFISAGKRMVAGEDYQACYDHGAVKLFGEPRILGEKPLNCGLVYYPEGILGSILTPAFLETALPLAHSPDNHLEQTLIAYAFWKSEGDFFPRDMLATTLEDNLEWRKGLNSLARHYAGGKHLFWRDV